MKRKFAVPLIAVFLTFASMAATNAHGGGLDGDGGHNCRVGSCAGTYHCHQAWGPGCGGGSSYTPKVKPELPTPACYPGNGEDITTANVALIQNKLKLAGYKLGVSDGVLGTKTRTALNSFEAKNGLEKSRKNSIYVASIEKLKATC